MNCSPMGQFKCSVGFKNPFLYGNQTLKCLIEGSFDPLQLCIGSKIIITGTFYLKTD